MNSPSSLPDFSRLSDRDLERESAEFQVQGDHEAARAILDEASRRHPAHPGILLALLKSLLKLRKAREATELTLRIQKLAASHPVLLDQLGEELQTLYEFDLALETFALLQNFPHPQVRAVGKARETALHLRAGDPDKARQALEQALQLAPDIPEVLSSTALWCRKENPERAKAILEKLSAPAAGIPPSFTIGSAHLLAGVCDDLGLTDEAMIALHRGKALEERDPLVQRFRTQRDAWRQWHGGAFDFTAEQAAAWTEGAGKDRRHALLLGHPRSGTTLLEQMLDAHSGIRSVEESDLYATTVEATLIRSHALEAGERSFGDWLHALDPCTLRSLRQSYFSRLWNEAGDPSEENTVIDKNPALTICLSRLPLTLPHTRIIVVLRDPRDVCLSAYFQATRRTPWSVNWLSLGETVDQYVFTMNLWLGVREKLAQPWVETRYEDIVEDPAREGSRITRFLGLEWEPTQEDPADHARGKLVRSPTHADVIQPLHSRAVGRWHRYEKHLAPYQEKLAPLIAAFGYS
ncbi:tetratricopeptide repeat-containing sulfotransferase family protein [Luteolibacter luteus]|uniref:Sulfotransferase family protein n=1 Tax=Luteolibacter luteus TaxID=2728835 RepID=A0A858RGS2_9BACT|nr:sulfotransferase [Luteolibacter luteus]QJE95781.1 hypothetical protein HHL09_08275 [Luteolibacter luteus]